MPSLAYREPEERRILCFSNREGTENVDCTKNVRRPEIDLCCTRTQKERTPPACSKRGKEDKRKKARGSERAATTEARKLLKGGLGEIFANKRRV